MGTALITYLLLAANAVMTYKGLQDRSFQERFRFHVDSILIGKEYQRLFTSAFLHTGWSHFGFNMVTLYLFGEDLERLLGIIPFVSIYVGSLLGGNLLSLFLHRQHGSYSAVGASGAISGLIFASISLFPEASIGFLLLPVAIPAWLFGVGYVLYTIYGVYAQQGRIGHGAHLGGGLMGMLIAILLYPGILQTNYVAISLIIIPAVSFLIVVIAKPYVLINAGSDDVAYDKRAIEHEYNLSQAAKQAELDRLLDKINQKGYDKLSEKEKERLKELSE